MSSRASQNIRRELRSVASGAEVALSRLTAKEEQNRRRCESSLAEFVQQAWSIIEPSPLTWAPYLDIVCEELETLTRGEANNLMLLMPPGSAKSLLVSVFWPAWEWIGQPGRRYITASYAMSLATRDARRTRELLQSSWYRRLWGDKFTLAGDQNVKSRYANDRGGYRLAVSTGSATTGERGDTLVYDDPSQLEAAFYTTELDKAARFFDVTLTSRGIGDATRRVLVAQRIHVDDVPGRVLDREGENWRVCILPMTSDPGLRIRAGGRSYGQHAADERAPGELLNPHLTSEAHVRKLEVSYGGRADAILQQAPTREQGAVFRRGWFRYFIEREICGRATYVVGRDRRESEGVPARPRDRCVRIVTVDLASSLDERADFTVYQAWAITPNAELLLLDQLRERISGNRHLPELETFCERHTPGQVFVESVGFQQSFVQQAAARGLPVVENKRTKGQHKQLRVIPLVQMLYEGRVFLPIEAEWLPGFEDELLGFPSAPHDDIVDAAADAAEVVARGGYVIPLDPSYRPANIPDYLAGPFGAARDEMLFGDAYPGMLFG